MTDAPTVECPDCKAKPGEWCVVLPGNSPWQHEARGHPDLSVLGEATGTDPIDLMGQIGRMIHVHYIAVSASRFKADKLAEKILVFLTDHYEKEAIASTKING